MSDGPTDHVKDPATDRATDRATHRATQAAIREVRGVVSGSQQHYSRAVRAGGLVFLSGNGFDGDGEPLPSAVPPAPYHLSDAAHCVYQTRTIFDAYRPLLAEFGCTFEDMVQIEQYIPHKIQGDSYVNTSRGPGYLERNRPTSALLVTGDLAPRGAVVAQSGIAAIPSGDGRKEIIRADHEFTAGTAKAEYGDSWANEPPFHEIEAAGPYLFTVGDIALDWDKGEIPPGVKVAPFTYWGSEIRNETEFLLNRLQGFVERVGGTLQDITHVTLYLSEVGDVFEMDRVWQKWFGATPPTRTVVPVRAQGSPRLESPGQTHADDAVRLEHITQGVRPGHGATREIIETPYRPLGHESVAIRAGDFLWISEQYARDPDPADAIDRVSGDTASQLEVIFGRLAEICRSAGADLARAVRVRAFFADPAETHLLADRLRAVFPDEPPTVLTSGAGGELLLPGARVVVDAVVHTPR